MFLPMYDFLIAAIAEHEQKIMLVWVRNKFLKLHGYISNYLLHKSIQKNEMAYGYPDTHKSLCFHPKFT